MKGGTRKTKQNCVHTGSYILSLRSQRDPAERQRESKKIKVLCKCVCNTDAHIFNLFYNTNTLCTPHSTLRVFFKYFILRILHTADTSIFIFYICTYLYNIVRHVQIQTSYRVPYQIYNIYILAPP